MIESYLQKNRLSESEYTKIISLFGYFVSNNPSIVFAITFSSLYAGIQTTFNFVTFGYTTRRLS